jgi:hypothetical protein
MAEEREIKKRRTVSNLVSATAHPLMGDTIPLPKCQHGSALMFERTDTKTGVSRQFYACSVSRDRKVCPLFHWKDDWDRKVSRGSYVDVVVPNGSKSVDTTPDKAGFAALTDNKANAQYFFSDDSVSIITDLCRAFGRREKMAGRPVLCLGTPTIHQSLVSQGVESFLFDDDDRLIQKFAPNSLKFNMFNGNSYGQELTHRSNYSIIVIDPPFQPELIPSLFHTLTETIGVSHDTLVLMAFPYFNQKQAQNCSQLKLTEIRLIYRNHKKFNKLNKSPVRLYSSLPIREIITLNHPEYRLCSDCDDYVYNDNIHCNKCEKCTGIHGKYKHCDDCGKCVKERAVHCEECRRCFLNSHKCSGT